MRRDTTPRSRGADGVVRSRIHGRLLTSNPRPAFTLVELLVVLAIIMLLAAIIMPSLQRAKIYTRLAICLSNQKQIGTAVRSYAAAHSLHLPAWYDGLRDPYQTRTSASKHNNKKHNHYLLYDRQHIDPRLSLQRRTEIPFGQLRRGGVDVPEPVQVRRRQPARQHGRHL